MQRNVSQIRIVRSSYDGEEKALWLLKPPPFPLKKPLKIALACSGIGHVSRGYEASLLEVYEATRKSPHQISLFRGGRNEERGQLCPTFPRCHKLYQIAPFGRISSYRRYWLENFFFTFFLFLRIQIRPVDIIFTPDHIVADNLRRIRKLIRGRPALIFSNGAPFENEFCKRFEFIHQKSKEHYHEEEAPDSKMFLIGNSFDTIRFEKPADFDQTEARKANKLPTDKKIILCLSALNPEHKRVDWIIDEVAKLDNRFHLLLCGQEGPKTPALMARAKQAGIQYSATKVSISDVPNLIWCADLMVLGSLSEGFPRVIAEAMASKTPIFVHPHENGKWILGEDSGCFADMTIEGDLASKILKWTEGGAPQQASIDANFIKVNQEYSREAILPKYLAMFEWVGQETAKLI